MCWLCSVFTVKLPSLKIVLKMRFDDLLYLLKPKQFQDNEMNVFDIDAFFNVI